MIAKFHEKLVAGMLQRGYEQEFAERVFRQISGFGEYGFPESHAASFALLVYVSAWLKRHHPSVFAAALINSQPMGFYAPAQLVRDARLHGVQVLPADVGSSDWDCTLEAQSAADPTGPFRHRDEKLALRLGLRLLRGFSEQHARKIEQARRIGGAFRSFEDFARRTGLPRHALQVLARADALASLRIDRRSALWKSLPARESVPLMDASPEYDDQEVLPELPGLTPQDQVVADYSTAGLSLRQHPVSFLRKRLDELRAVTSESLAVLQNDRRVRVAGLVLMRQRPSTAAGITFVTLEDETGAANLVVYPNVWQQFRPAARFAGVLLATGRLQREGDIIHVVCERLDDLSELLKNLDSRSRDFH